MQRAGRTGQTRRGVLRTSLSTEDEEKLKEAFAAHEIEA
jgi:uncharacterized membrane protein